VAVRPDKPVKTLKVVYEDDHLAVVIKPAGAQETNQQGI
jgi:23S rRNA-/tRNA-specific pseudouridylate synthase